MSKAEKCRPIVHRSRFTGHWTWDCEDHEDGGTWFNWSVTLADALRHRVDPEDPEEHEA